MPRLVFGVRPDADTRHSIRTARRVHTEPRYLHFLPPVLFPSGKAEFPFGFQLFESPSIKSKKTGIGSAIMQSGCNQRDAKTLAHCLIVNGAEHQNDVLAGDSLQD